MKIIGNGSVSTCGRPGNKPQQIGILGQGIIDYAPFPMLIIDSGVKSILTTDTSAYVLLNNGSVLVTGSIFLNFLPINVFIPTLIPRLSGVIGILGGENYAFFFLSNSNLFNSITIFIKFLKEILKY